MSKTTKGVFVYPHVAGWDAETPHDVSAAIEEAVQIIVGLTPDELLEFARQLAGVNSSRADNLADVLIDAVFVQGIIVEASKQRHVHKPVLFDNDADMDCLVGMAQ